MSLLRRIRRSQAGFTLIELMVAVSVGSVVILAAFMLLDNSVVLTKKTTDRVDSTQRGRIALEQVMRQLRSQVCPNSTTPAIVGGGTLPQGGSDDYGVAFYTSLQGATFAPEKHVVYYNPTQNTLLEEDYSLAGALLRTRTLATNVVPPRTGPNNTSAPIFVYKAYPATAGTDPSVTLPTPLSAANAATVAEIDIGFSVVPTGVAIPSVGVLPKGTATFVDQIFARASNPNATTGPTGPVCT